MEGDAADVGEGLAGQDGRLLVTEGRSLDEAPRHPDDRAAAPVVCRQRERIAPPPRGDPREHVGAAPPEAVDGLVRVPDSGDGRGFARRQELKHRELRLGRVLRFVEQHMREPLPMGRRRAPEGVSREEHHVLKVDERGCAEARLVVLDDRALGGAARWRLARALCLATSVSAERTSCSTPRALRTARISLDACGS